MFSKYKIVSKRKAVSCDDHEALWATRLAVRLQSCDTITRDEELEAVLQACGFNNKVWADCKNSRLIETLLLERLGELEALAEVIQADLTAPPLLNIVWLGERIGLTALEILLLGLAVAMQREGFLRESFRQLAEESRHVLLELIAGVLGVSLEETTRALAPSGRLARSRLLRLGRGNGRHSELPLQLMEGLHELLKESFDSPDELLMSFFRPCPAGALELEDFNHMDSLVESLKRLLQGALETRRAGCNVLIYGPPGTGKTELAHLLARLADARLHGITVEGETSEEQLGHFRRTSRQGRYGVCQEVLRHTPRALVLFDECEELFPTRSSTLDRLFGDPAPLGFGREKGQMNYMLEHNPAPTLWIANRVDGLDPSFLRRFDHVVRMDVPPTAARARIAARYLAPVQVSEALRVAIAAQPAVTPADMERVARVLQSMGLADTAAADHEATLLLTSALEARGVAFHPQEQVTRGLRYDSAAVNADVDVERLIEGLRREGRGAIGLFGPPGTGKTELVYHVGRSLGREVLRRRASDLLGPFVGMTEARIADAFRKARQQRAILLLDEVDSFLSERRGATRSWEVSLVNELLVQIEGFDGVVFCASNLVERLDEAIFRRLPVKIRFDWLRPDQAERRFLQIAERLQLAPPDGAALERVRRMESLGLGDFEAARARLALLGAPTPADLIAALEAELAFKNAASQSRRRAGFQSVGEL